MDKLLSTLNPEQLAAVEYTDGPELVIAGAGSGKTRVLTYKIAYLISRGIKPWSILALTFTNKAAREMKERVGAIVGPDASRYLQMGTFHSIFLRILRVEAEAIGLRSNFTIYDDTDSRALVGSIVREMGLDDKIYKPASVLSRIGMAKNNLITPEAYLGDGSLAERDQRSNMPKVGEIYQMYARRCRIANAIDFDDMLLFTYTLFANNDDIRRKYASRFEYVLVDEFQDTNYAQQCIVTLLTKERGKICVVGDDAQSIYAFRGANIDNILNFQNIYQNVRLFKLERNYRSTKSIVEAANCLIAHNQKQIRKHVFSENSDGEKVHVDIAYSDKEEASIVASRIMRVHVAKKVAYSNMAILYRTNAQSRIFEDEMRRQGIPYLIYGGMSFYQRKEIKDIIAYFRLVGNTEDEEALKRVINYPKRGIGNTTVDKLVQASREHEVSLWRVVSEPMVYATQLSPATQRKVWAFAQLIQSFVDDRLTTDVFTLGKRIVEETGVTRELALDKTDDAKDKMENVEEFVSGIRDFVDTKREEGFQDEVYVSNFLQEIALLSDTDKDSDKDGAEDADRVIMMTVHASKGLEFDTVFIVGMEENLFPSQRSLTSARELEEERRLFYVALTRAENRCYVSCAKSRYQYGNMQFNPISRFLREIDANLLNVSGGTIRSSSDGLMNRGDAQTHRNGIETRRNVASTASRLRFAAEPPKVENPSRFTRIHTATSGLATQRTNGLANEQHKMETNVRHTVYPGAKVEHQRFGLGTVVSVEGNGENEKAIVDFDKAGKKTLLMKFARLKLV